jgi:hypothetical protein
MAFEKRKEVRVNLPEGKLSGMIKLHHEMNEMPVCFNNVSPSGAALTITIPVDKLVEKKIQDLATEAKKGLPTPVLLLINNAKIPVTITNIISVNRIGVTINTNERVTALAEQARTIFVALVKYALKYGQEQSALEEYAVLSRDFLPKDIQEFTDSQDFDKFAMSALAKHLPEMIPKLKGRETSQEELYKITDLCQNFLAQKGVDLAFMCGTEIARLKRTVKGKTNQELLPDAITVICSQGKLFHSAKDIKEFEDALGRGILKKRPEDMTFEELPPKHPLVALINARVATFVQGSNYLMSLSPFLGDFYYLSYVPRDSDLVQMLGEDNTVLKGTVYQWVHNLLTQISSMGRKKSTLTNMEYLLKQALYEILTFRKATALVSTDINNLIEGKLPKSETEIRNRFFASICQVIDKEVQDSFLNYKKDFEEAQAAVNAEAKDIKIASQMRPVDLVIKYIWPKIMQIGILSQTHRSSAESWLPPEFAHVASKLGGVVFTTDSFSEFVVNFPSPVKGEKTDDYFDRIDLKELYEKTVSSGGETKKDLFGVYIDSIQPKALKDILTARVLNSAAWNNYYILKRAKSHFIKVYGGQGKVWTEYILKNMLQ